MTVFSPSNATKVLAVTAVLAAILFTVGHADAGTQMPYWKKKQLLNSSTVSVVPPTPSATQGESENKLVIVEEMTPVAKPIDNEQKLLSDDNWPSDNGQAGGNKPAAAPTPSAVLGGIAMLGLVAGRRRRQQDDLDS